MTFYSSHGLEAARLLVEQVHSQLFPDLFLSLGIKWLHRTRQNNLCDLVITMVVKNLAMPSFETNKFTDLESGQGGATGPR